MKYFDEVVESSLQNGAKDWHRFLDFYCESPLTN